MNTQLCSTFSSYLIITFFFLFITSSTASSHNIVQLLSTYPRFTNYSHYLIQTKVADEINRRQNITVLVMDNSGIGLLAEEPAYLQKKLMLLHVILDNFDITKIKLLKKHKKQISKVPTLLHEYVKGDLGFLNVGYWDEAKDLGFGSAVQKYKDVPLTTPVLQYLLFLPGISILEIGMPAIPHGMEIKPTKMKA